MLSKSGIRVSVNLATASKRNFVSSFSGWTNRLFSLPKGFRNYYPKGAEKNSAEVGAAGKSGPKNGGNGGNGGSNGGSGKKGDKPNIDPEDNRLAVIVLLLLTGLAFQLSGSNTPGGLANDVMISYSDFHNKILPTGKVQKITVRNKTIAEIEMQPEAVPTTSVLQVNHEENESSSTEEQFVDSYVPFSEETRKSAAPVAHARRVEHHHPPTKYYVTIGTLDGFERKLEESSKFYFNNPNFIPVSYADDVDWAGALFKGALFAGVIASMVISSTVMKKGGAGGFGGMLNVGKSKAKKITKEMVNVTFKDVAGCDEAKKEIMEFVEFLKNPKRFTALGAKIPKGAMISGPPGTGKTLLAKATAGEAHVPFFSISGSDFIEMFVGVGSSRVRDLFKEARQSAPCIIFIDEIDAIGRKRGSGRFGGGHDERESTLNQLLVEMDGFEPTSGVVVLAGTNRVDILDPALLRPGRFDRKITVDAPDIQGRKAIFMIYLKNLKLTETNVEMLAGRLAGLTPGFAGADIANICNEAAIIAARKEKSGVDLKDFETATERVIGGLESHKLISPEEKRIVAFHEAGHAVAGWNLQYADPLLKVTIIPRGNGALGFAQYLPKEVFLRHPDQLMDMVCMALAGRASEQVNFGRVTTGASDDLRRVTQIVYQMVQVFGMNERIGQVSFPRDDSGGPTERSYGNATAEIMDAEVKKVIDEAYKRTLALIEDKGDQVKAVAELLLQKETITHIDIAHAIGKRPFASDKDYEEFITTNWDPATA